MMYWSQEVVTTRDGGERAAVEGCVGAVDEETTVRGVVIAAVGTLEEGGGDEHGVRPVGGGDETGEWLSVL